MAAKREMKSWDKRIIPPLLNRETLRENARTRVVSRAAKNNWSTPDYVLDRIRFVLDVKRVWFDPCGNKQNTTDAKVFLTKDTARPACEWPAPPDESLVYQNHPYDKNLHWALNAIYYADKFRMVPFHYVVLANNSSGTEWFTLLTKTCNAFVCLDGRLPFINPRTGKKINDNNYGTCLWYYGPFSRMFADGFRSVGASWHREPNERQIRIAEPHEIFSNGKAPLQ